MSMNTIITSSPTAATEAAPLPLAISQAPSPVFPIAITIDDTVRSQRESSGSSSSTSSSDDENDFLFDDDQDDSFQKLGSPSHGRDIDSPFAQLNQNSFRGSSQSNTKDDDEEVETGQDHATFLNASIQLLQRQSDTRQNLRKLWHFVQKLRFEQHINDTALERLHAELLGMLESLNVEDLEKFTFKKMGKLLVLRSLEMSSIGVAKGNSSFHKHSSKIGGNKTPASPRESFKAVSDSDKKSWCILFMEQGRFEIHDSEDEPFSTSSIIVDAATPFAPQRKSKKSSSNVKRSILGKQSSNSSSDSIPGGSNASLRPSTLSHSSNILSKLKMTGTFLWSAQETQQSTDTKIIEKIDLYGCQCQAIHEKYGEHRFQLRTMDNVVYVFEAKNNEEQADWVACLQNTCRSDIMDIKQRIDAAKYREDYLSSLSLPLSIPSSWLRRSIQRHEKGALARRNSKNLSMLQISRDLERDRMIFDGEMISGSAGVQRVIKLLVDGITQFLHDKKQESSSTVSALDSDASRRINYPMSPTSRIMNCQESKALAFAERVLRGSSRTQSGGDIYDAISMVYANPRVMICPVSQDATPVSLTTKRGAHGEGEGGEVSLTVQVEVSMSFKILSLSGEEEEKKEKEKEEEEKKENEKKKKEKEEKEKEEKDSSGRGDRWKITVDEDLYGSMMKKGRVGSEWDNPWDHEVVTTQSPQTPPPPPPPLPPLQPLESQPPSFSSPPPPPPNNDENIRRNLPIMASENIWAFIRGTLHREFTFGKSSEPGFVVIDWQQQPSSFAATPSNSAHETGNSLHSREE